MGVIVKPKARRAAGIAAGASVQILGLEVTQSVQNLQHAVSLIRGKQTVVRVYLQASGFTTKQTLRGEIAVALSPGAPAKYVASANAVSVSAASPPDLAAQRRDVDLSLNFILPTETLNWASLAITVNHIRSATGDVPFTGPGSVAVQLNDAPPLRIKAVGLRYVWTKPDGTTAEVSPEAFHFDYLRSFLTRAYPVASLQWSQLVIEADPAFGPPFSGPTSPDGDDPLWRGKLDLAHNQLAAVRAKDIEAGTDPRTHYYGVVSDASAGLFFRGAAKAVPQTPDPSVVAVGPTGNPRQYPSLSWDRDASYGDWYGTHELSHTFGRFHPGFCNQDASDPTFPYPDGRIGDAAHGDMIGLDVGDASLNLPMVALSNESAHDIMTYCSDQWMSSYSYEAVLARLRLEDTQFAPPVS
jgi:hypothetical protein